MGGDKMSEISASNSSSSSSSKSNNNAAILEQIKGIQKTIDTLNNQIKQIEDAMENYEIIKLTVKLTGENCIIPQAEKSNNFILSGSYSVVNNTATFKVNYGTKVKDILTKVGEQCGSGGKILSQEGAVMAAAEAKIAEYKARITLLENEIETLEALLE